MADAKKTADAWMPLLVEKYERDTKHLTTEQHGAYLLLLMAGWQRDGVLPDHDGQLAAIAHLTPARWRSHRSVLRPFFTPDGAGNLIQKRLLIEVERAQHLSVVRAEAGRSRPKPDSKTGAIAPANAPPNDPANAPTNAPAIAVANAELLQGQLGGQLGDYRGSPNPSSTASDDPSHLTQDTDKARALSSRATPAGEACKAMKEAGLAEVNPSNPTLLTMLEQGATPSEFHFAAVKAVEAHKGFAYALAIVKGDREDAARVALAPKRGIPDGFIRPKGTPNVLPDDLPDLNLDESETSDEHASRARG